MRRSSSSPLWRTTRLMCETLRLLLMWGSVHTHQHIAVASVDQGVPALPTSTKGLHPSLQQGYACRMVNSLGCSDLACRIRVASEGRKVGPGAPREAAMRPSSLHIYLGWVGEALCAPPCTFQVLRGG